MYLKINSIHEGDTVEIVGIPTNIANNELENKTIEILESINVRVNPNDIQACHRLYDGERTIVKFQNRKSALQALLNRTALKDTDKTLLGFNAQSKLFINYSLCPHYRMLHGKLKSLHKKGEIFGFWVTNGSVRYRIKDQGQSVTVQHIRDLEVVFGNSI